MESDEYKMICMVQGTVLSGEPVVDGGLDYGKQQNFQNEANALVGVTGSPGPAGHRWSYGMAMPPELITLTALDFECKFDHVHIPMDVTASYVEAAPESGQVSATIAKRLLMHIAGLTSIAQRRSLEAREQLIMMKRKHDMLAAEVEDEMRRLKKAITSCMQIAVEITSDEAAGNVEVHGGSRSIVGYEEHCSPSPTTVLHGNDKKNEGCAPLETDVEIGPDDNIGHTSFTLDSHGPSQLKGDAQSHVHGDGGQHESTHRWPN
ncbi:hypothetical protein M0R45_008819 [Rubus argutus]|uniref:Uncharacterized protein n=1 Tax=Rubus argutus TaxID=59490 RepID=A0AAW1Y377_RUBAR